MTEIRTPSPRRGTNLPRMGDFNLTVILDAIRRATGGLSRVELAQIVGLSPQTISNISRRLLDQNLIVEAGKEGSGPGKPRTMLRLNPGGMYAVGVHLDPAVTDLRGAGPGRRRRPACTDQDPRRERAGRRHRHHRRRNRAAGRRTPAWTAAKVAGLGVASPGPIDLEERHRGGSAAAAGLGPGAAARRPGRRPPGYSVLVDKDVTSAAVAETWAGGPSGAGQLRLHVHGHRHRLRHRAQRRGGPRHIRQRRRDRPHRGGSGRTALRLRPARLREVLGHPAGAGGQRPRPPASWPALRTDQQRCRRCSRASRNSARSAYAGNEAAMAIIGKSAVLVARAVSVVTNTLDVERVVFGGPFWSCLAPALPGTDPGPGPGATAPPG